MAAPDPSFSAVEKALGHRVESVSVVNTSRLLRRSPVRGRVNLT
jgi:hypothetical protein